MNDMWHAAKQLTPFWLINWYVHNAPVLLVLTTSSRPKASSTYINQELFGTRQLLGKPL